MNSSCRVLQPDEFAQALAIRLKVFVDEQNVPVEEEQDSYDSTAIHFGVYVDDTMVGTGRLVDDHNKGKIGRMAVLKEYRGLGLGAKLLQTIVDHARELGLSQCYLGSQTHAIPFYEKLGFAAEGDIFDDAGIPHRTMRLHF